MKVTYNKEEAEKELSIKEMQEKTIVVQNNKKIKTLEILIGIDIILAFISFIISGLIICKYMPTFDLSCGLFIVVSIVILVPAVSIGNYLSDLQTKLLDKNKEIKTLSLNTKYHKYHENKELFSSEVFLGTLKLNFMDKSGKVYKEYIDIEDFETIMVDGITDTEVNLYEKKIYKPNPNFVSFHAGTPQNCSRQIHKNKRKINFKVLRGN